MWIQTLWLVSYGHHWFTPFIVCPTPNNFRWLIIKSKKKHKEKTNYKEPKGKHVNYTHLLSHPPAPKPEKTSRHLISSWMSSRVSHSNNWGHIIPEDVYHNRERSHWILFNQLDPKCIYFRPQTNGGLVWYINCFLPQVTSHSKQGLFNYLWIIYVYW